MEEIGFCKTIVAVMMGIILFDVQPVAMNSWPSISPSTSTININIKSPYDSLPESFSSKSNEWEYVSCILKYCNKQYYIDHPKLLPLCFYSCKRTIFYKHEHN